MKTTDLNNQYSYYFEAYEYPDEDDLEEFDNEGEEEWNKVNYQNN